MQTLTAIVEQAAENYGPKDAFIFRPGFRTKHWSHADVWERTNRVAALLAQRDIKPGDRVLVWAPNAPEWSFSLLGARAGAVAVPLDLRSEPQFVQDVVRRTEPRLAFVSRMTPIEHALAGLPMVNLEGLHGAIAAVPAAPPHHETFPEDLAEIVFTSGTTGNPKGVMLTHGNIAAGVESTERIVPRDCPDRMLSVLPLSHMFKGRKKDLIVPHLGAPLEVHAVLLLEEGADPRAIVRAANEALAAHQQITGHTVWPHEDFPRTHTLKVKKNEVLNELIIQSTESPDEVAHPEPGVYPEGSRREGQAMGDPSPAVSPLVRLIASLCKKPPAEITQEARLGDDLNLDSLGRVELLSAIESELGVALEEGAVGPETTVAGLERLVDAATGTRTTPKFLKWPLNPFVRAFGELAHRIAIMPIYRTVYDLRYQGREHLRDLGSPAIFAANHNVHWDPPLVYIGLPAARRMRLAIAAADDDVFGIPWKAVLGPMLGNAFPVSRETNVRASLEYIGRLLDLGWSVQIFPEGRMTEGGPIQPFKPGAGLLAVESATPVVPVRIDLEKPSWLFQKAPFPQRGRVTVRYGQPLVFPPGSDYVEATKQLEDAVRNL